MPRDDSGDCDWRSEAIGILRKKGFDGDILDPTNPEYDQMGEDAYDKQTRWEYLGMRIASVILYWIPRTEKNIGLTTNFELGEWISDKAAFVGCPEDSYRNRYVFKCCEMVGKICYTSLDELCQAVVDYFSEPTRVFFTSDTHFGQERTLELSARPFRSVSDMDITLISNWNKRLRSCDVIYHLGDFGDFSKLEVLNFGKMFFVKGNYEDKMDKEEFVSGLLSDERVSLVPAGGMIEIDGETYRLCHEPMNGLDYWGEWFWLFGHIHRLQIVKENGVNVGCDCYQWHPVSFDEIRFLRNGIENHFDENVFCKIVGEIDE